MRYFYYYITYDYAFYTLGIGYASTIMCSLLNIYYNVIIAWSLFYFFAIFQKVLPWSSCTNDWNTDNCVESGANVANMSNTTASSEEYWECVIVDF